METPWRCQVGGPPAPRGHPVYRRPRSLRYRLIRMCSMSLMWPAGEADPRARGPGELVAHAGVGGVVHGPAEFPTTTRLGATSPQSRGHSVHDWLSLRSLRGCPLPFSAHLRLRSNEKLVSSVTHQRTIGLMTVTLIFLRSAASQYRLRSTATDEPHVL